MMPCPRCQQAVEPTPVGYTWWGGAVGPRLIHHVECPGCRARYNRKTGRSNDTAIAIYLAVSLSIAIAIIYAIN
jgi:hypothetical protein